MCINQGASSENTRAPEKCARIFYRARGQWEKSKTYWRGENQRYKGFRSRQDTNSAGAIMDSRGDPDCLIRHPLALEWCWTRQQRQYGWKRGVKNRSRSRRKAQVTPSRCTCLPWIRIRVYHRGKRRRERGRERGVLPRIDHKVRRDELKLFEETWPYRCPEPLKCFRGSDR